MTMTLIKTQTLRLFFLPSIVLIFWSCQSTKHTLASSYWKYSDNDIEYEIYFRPDGHVASYHPNDATPENDYWKQHGNRITFYMNDRYATYKGKKINDSTLIGQGKSKGFQWTWKAKFISKD